MTTARRGFTLVELLVAVALAIVILGLAIYVVNSATYESYKVIGSSDRLSQWLMTAKSRALRDKAPRGVRLFVTTDAAGNQVVTECAYIEMPDPYNPPVFASGKQILLHLLYQAAGDGSEALENNKRVFISFPDNATRTDFINNVTPNRSTLVVPALNFSSIITAVPNSMSAGSGAGVPGTPTLANGDPLVELSLQTKPDIGSGYSNGTTQQQTSTFVTNPGGSGFIVIRQPDLIQGQDTLQITSGMAVDVTPLSGWPGPEPAPSPALSYIPPWRNSLNAVPNTLNQIDILFAPTGEVIGAGGGVIALLLRNVQKRPEQLDVRDQRHFDKAGEMVIVCVYPKTGTVATQPVAPPSANDPFKFAKDGINTGL